ncbi:MAG: helix-turn-helix domain-containing protein [Akkermansiaceae bacterium]
MESPDNNTNGQTDIGKQLRKARENKKLTHADVLKATRIPEATLTALETNDYSSLPISYARSFLIQYCEFLEVDAGKSVDALKPDDVPINIDDHSYLQSSLEQVRKKGERPSKGQNRKRRSKGSSAFLAWQWITPVMPGLIMILLISAALIGACIFAYQKYLQGDGDSPATEARVTNSANSHSETIETAPADSTESEALPASSEVPPFFGPLFMDHVLGGAHRNWHQAEPSSPLADDLSQVEDSSPTLEPSDQPETPNEPETDGEEEQDSSPPPKALLVDETEE